MFTKYGDGKIVNVLDEEQLTELQKKSVKKISKQTNIPTDTSSIEKKSGS